MLRIEKIKVRRVSLILGDFFQISVNVSGEDLLSDVFFIEDDCFIPFVFITTDSRIWIYKESYKRRRAKYFQKTISKGEKILCRTGKKEERLKHFSLREEPIFRSLNIWEKAPLKNFKSHVRDGEKEERKDGKKHHFSIEGESSFLSI